MAARVVWFALVTEKISGAMPVRAVAVISSSAPSLSNFRGPLLAALVSRGVTVHALAPDYDDVTRERVRQRGAIPVDIKMDRTGIHPFRDLLSVIHIARTLRRLKVDATFAYFIKPVIFGSIAAFVARVPRRFALIAGLGYVFTDDGVPDMRRSVLRAVVSVLYRFALATCTRVFFQNRDDMVELSHIAHIVSEKAILTNGTGVEIANLQPAPVPDGPPVFLFVGRLLREKGVEQLVAAAKLVRFDHPEVRVRLVGGFDSNPGSIDQERIDRDGWRDAVELVGHVSDVAAEIRASTVFVLPSWREGKPRSTQEAMAFGRAVITSDAPGCRDTVREGVNGFLVPLRDPVALAAAMRRFVREPELARRMGRESRAMAEELFDTEKINAGILDAMGIHAVATTPLP